MRLTVGPLPPAVYWRRRAVVLGAGLLFLIVVLYSCSGSERKTGSSGTGTSASPTAPGQQPNPTGSVLTPQSGNPPSATPTSGDSGGNSGGSEGGQGGPAGGGTGTGDGGAGAPVNPVVDDGTCADSEIKVTAVASPATAQTGAIVTLRLKIKNISERTCSRNVGADLQELFIKAGADRIWSSDTCGTGKGSDVQSFTPNFERFYQLDWNGRYSTKCANGVANGAYAQPGTYQVFARVGTKLSEPVRLTITN